MQHPQEVQQWESVAFQALGFPMMFRVLLSQKHHRKGHWWKRSCTSMHRQCQDEEMKNHHVQTKSQQRASTNLGLNPISNYFKRRTVLVQEEEVSRDLYEWWKGEQDPHVWWKGEQGSPCVMKRWAGIPMCDEKVSKDPHVWWKGE